ncbi:hypothetical protein LGM65_16575 [Burkholderia anthina]|nr:hypothetical protein [Burkholderia anthina]MCA8092485.1 hypothetical protein [Burkholderia anthina]
MDAENRRRSAGFPTREIEKMLIRQTLGVQKGRRVIHRMKSPHELQ